MSNGQVVFKNFKNLIASMPHADLVTKYGTADLDELFKRGSKGNFTNPALRNDWKFVSNCVFGAFAADWREDGKEDPHGDYYTRSQRGDLALGSISDDALANLVFMDGDKCVKATAHPDTGNYLSPIAIVTAAKERLRYLSRRVVHLEDQLIENNIQPTDTK